MTQYLIVNRNSGLELGVYVGDSEADAWKNLCGDVGTQEEPGEDIEFHEVDILSIKEAVDTLTPGGGEASGEWVHGLHPQFDLKENLCRHSTVEEFRLFLVDTCHGIGRPDLASVVAEGRYASILAYQMWLAELLENSTQGE